jgi:hypothetical protein
MTYKRFQFVLILALCMLSVTACSSSQTANNNQRLGGAAGLGMLGVWLDSLSQ